MRRELPLHLERRALPHPEAMLLIRNDHAEVLILHAFGDQRVRTDHDIDLPAGQCRERFFALFAMPRAH